ncbi:hypothetical protein OROGR_003808 [Orobanche gracilis]
MGDESESSVCKGEDEQVSVNIRFTNSSKFSVKTNLQSTVAEFKVLLAQHSDVAAGQQRLIYKGRILKDDQTLISYGLQADHTVHMVRGFAPAVTTPSAVPASAANTQSVPAATQVGSTNTVGAGVASPFAGLDLSAFGGTGGASGLFGAGLPEFEQMQQLTQNPNMMREIMNMPAIQSVMNNPEIMRSLIMSNPQMREIIDRNPELGHVLNDPSILRQTLEAARNPELMREMMRNTDRAMSNIESSPEGFNMLRRMYENVQEPFLNATTTGGGGAAADAGSNPFAALLGNQSGNQTREGPDLSTDGPEATPGTTIPNSNPLPNPWSNTGNSRTNNAATTNPTGDARIPSIAGVGGLGHPELGHMGMSDPSAFSQFLQNPAITQMMQSYLNDPQYMNRLLGLHPQFRNMVDANPQLRDMMQNPEFLRELTSPATMQQMMALQLQRAQLSRPQSNLCEASTEAEGSQSGQGRAGVQNNMGLDLLMNMFGGLGAGGLTAPNTPNVPPEELYATQLSQLQEMGFFDTQENIRALQATSGNVHAAVERLLGNPGQ